MKKPTRRHWTLASVSMVNWYMFAAQDIELRGSVALTGPNGSGKSSILDAIQTVLTGRSGRNLELNARVQTERGARRTVRDYILGALDDSAEGFSFKRDRATCYLMLGFRRTDDGREATVGLCMSARQDVPDEEMEARFLVQGRILRSADVARLGEDETGTWCETQPWPSVAAALRKQPDLQVDTESGPDRFVDALCRVLRPENRVVDARKFARNLKNCAAFKPVSSTTEFVRNFILDAQRLNLSELRQSIARFKDIRAKIAETKTRVSDADGLADKAEKVRTRARTFMHHRLTLTQGRLHLSAAELGAARREHAETVAALEDINGELPQLAAELESASTRVDELVRLEANDRSAAAAQAAEREAAVARETAGRLRAELASLSRLAADIVQAAPLLGGGDEITAAAMEAFNEGGSSPESRVAELPGSPLAASVAAVVKRMGGEADSLALEAMNSQVSLDALRERVARAREGRRVLGDGTQELVRLLKVAGLNAVPLCDLVTRVDAKWRPVMESILGHAREALIVAPENYEQALKLYRSSSVRNAQIVNTTKAASARPVRKGTLAAMVETDDSHARQFLDYRLGAIAMVKTEVDLRREDSAATADMMYAAGRVVRRLQPPRALLLGSPSDPQTLKQMEDQFRLLEGELAARRSRVENMRSALRTLGGIVDRIDSIDPEAARIQIASLAEAEKAVKRHAGDAARLRGRDGGLSRQLVQARSELISARAYHDERMQERSKLDERLSNRAKRLAEAEVREGRDRGRAREVLESQGILLDPEEAAAVREWSQAALPQAPDMRRALSDPEGRLAAGERPGQASSLEVQLDFLEFNLLDYHRKRLANDRGNLMEEAARYVDRHGLEQPPFVAQSATMEPEARFDAASEWIADECMKLRRQVLVDYEQQAAEAHSDAIDHFRGDFVGKMRGAFHEISIRLRELNAQLAKRDFHTLTYRFDRKPSAAHRDMIELIERGDIDPAFDAENAAAGDALGRATRRLEELAHDPDADLSDIDDPRRYWEFDIGMDKDGVERTTMSKRLGTGSGGQVQVPYYVAICAALAATYYPDKTGADGGMALAIFDEAFNRMDTAVIGEVIEFMQDLGLQAFIAAPDKERATFMQFVETMVGISRVGDAVSIDVQYIKPYARERFRAENPALVGFEGYRDRLPDAAA